MLEQRVNDLETKLRDLVLTLATKGLIPNPYLPPMPPDLPNSTTPPEEATHARRASTK